ncbi:MAG: ketoacyl-ACP synthase III, partial [Proteobacteria bacterium]|nr:ketoacyl-ACP synthase III [Pseudomonadota bacterium]
MMKRIGIIGTGSYLPDRIMTNFDIEKFLGTSDEWIFTRTGIKARRIADENAGTSDLCKIACERAMEMAGVKPDDIDLLILATITPDTHCPAGSNWLEAKLKCNNAVSFDITAACSGFIFALHVADRMIRCGANKKALVVAGEIMSRVANWKERESCILWGDGAGAAVITETDEGAEIMSTHIHTDGASGDTLLMPGGGSKTTPISHESVDKG